VRLAVLRNMADISNMNKLRACRQENWDSIRGRGTDILFLIDFAPLWGPSSLQSKKCSTGKEPEREASHSTHLVPRLIMKEVINGLMVGETMSVITDVRYNQVKGYSRKYTIGYTAIRNKHGNAQREYIKVFISGFYFILNSFLTTKPLSTTFPTPICFPVYPSSMTGSVG
jgi:hypothetical protein